MSGWRPVATDAEDFSFVLARLRPDPSPRIGYVVHGLIVLLFPYLEVFALWLSPISSCRQLLACRPYAFGLDPMAPDKAHSSRATAVMVLSLILASSISVM